MSTSHAEADGGAPPAPPAGLTWGVKASFVGYVAGLPDGQILAGRGAQVLGPRHFNFEPDDDAAAGSGPALRFRGRLLMTGHGGMMYIELQDPWIEFADNGSAWLSAVFDDGAGADKCRRTLADLELDGPRLSEHGRQWAAMNVRLQGDAVHLFNGQYPAGQELDPLFALLPNA
jgi:hypothetical protein